jgi:hypothetical protein
MHPSLLPLSPSYFDTKRRNAAAQRYIDAVHYQRVMQRERTVMLAFFYLAAIVAGAAGLTIGNTEPAAGLTLLCAACILLYLTLVPPRD